MIFRVRLIVHASEEQINCYKYILSEQISKLIDSNDYFEYSDLNCDNSS